MKAFVSHAAVDAPLAEFLTASLGTNLGVTFFIMPRDAPPGLPWIDQIKTGIAQCDILWSIITPNSATRPWISAEWACFWYQGKPTAPLLAGVSFDTLWDPMKAYQSIVLDDVSSVTRFLKSVAEETGVQPPSGVLPLAGEIAREIPEIQRRQKIGNLEEVFRRLAASLRSGGPNIDPNDVQALIAGDRLDEVMQLATSDEAAPVKQRQVAMGLLESGRTGDAGRLAMIMANRAEARTIAVHIVRRMPRGATMASEEWTVLEQLYGRLRPPQRRDVLEAMDQSGVAPLGSWAAGPDPID